MLYCVNDRVVLCLIILVGYLCKPSKLILFVNHEYCIDVCLYYMI